MSAFTPAAERPQARAPEPDIQLPDPDHLDEDEAAGCEVVVTFFTHHSATTRREERLDLAALVGRIHATSAPTKEQLPWLKLARFGDTRTDKGSLRHNANVIAITGLEGDYDLGEKSLADAKDIIANSGIAAIIYPSPSYSPERPKWRALCPFSQEYPPADRDRFMARLNGLFGGIFSRESWVWSQSYYYGRVANPDHHATLFEGTPIDLADWLDAKAIGKAAERNAGRPAQPTSRPEDITEARIRGLVSTLLNNIRSAEDGEKHHTLRNTCLTLGGYLHLIGWSVDAAVEQAIGALPAADDWDHARETARWAIERGQANPLDLEDRPNPRPRHGPATPELDPDEPEPDDPASGPDDPPPEWDQQHPLADQDDVGIPAGELITEQVAMEAFVASFHKDLRYNHSSKSWLIWVGHFWKPDNRKLAFSWALKLCRQLALRITGKSRAKARLVVEKVRFSAAVEQAASAMPPISTAQEDWDANPWLLGTPCGVVDLRTGILRAGEKSDMITKVTAVTPAESPDCPSWDVFLDFAMHADVQRVRFLQRYFGYCLTGLTIEEIFLFLFGVAGAGKGTLIETITHIMGDYAGTAPMEVFTGLSWSPTEYYRADMVGKRLIVASEPERGAYWAEAFIKESTGGDTLSGRHPAGRPFRFKPTHKMALQGNHMPRLRGRSTGMERRLRIAPFDRKADPPDTNLKAKLRAEAPGILRWLIDGCLAWQKIGLQPPDAIKEANSKYFEAQDAFARWVDECCILDSIAEEPPGKLRKSFNNWAKVNGEDEILSGQAFAEAIDQFETTPPLIRDRTKHGRFVRGIRLKPEPMKRWRDDGSDADEPSR
jgi:P4 family phage/plasmid primase-like protien